MIIEQYVDMAGKIRILWQTKNLNSYLYKFDSLPTEEELTLLGELSDSENLLLKIEPLNLEIEDTFNIISTVIQAIKESDELTFENYLSYLSNLGWETQASLKLFMFKFVSKLLNSNSFSEEEGFNIVKEYLDNKSYAELERLFNIKF